MNLDWNGSEDLTLEEIRPAFASLSEEFLKNDEVVVHMFMLVDETQGT